MNSSTSFFNYEVHEALHVSEDEKQSLHEIITKIEKEYTQNIDKHSQELIISNIKLLLDYCTRYFDRQFYTRTNLNIAYDLGFEYPQHFAKVFKNKTGMSPSEYRTLN